MHTIPDTTIVIHFIDFAIARKMHREWLKNDELNGAVIRVKQAGRDLAGLIQYCKWLDGVYSMELETVATI